MLRWVHAANPSSSPGTAGCQKSVAAERLRLKVLLIFLKTKLMHVKFEVQLMQPNWKLSRSFFSFKMFKYLFLSELEAYEELCRFESSDQSRQSKLKFQLILSILLYLHLQAYTWSIYAVKDWCCGDGFEYHCHIVKQHKSVGNWSSVFCRSKTCRH